jgi:dipeptide/tripeptide permease
LFYMAINVGSLFAPTTAVGIKNYAMTEWGFSSNDAYHFAFAVACVALVLSIVIYYAFRATFRHVEGGKKKGEAAVVVDNLTPEQTKQRIVALCLVFAVVIFFWMAFHQNGLTLTYFADEFTTTTAFGIETMVFDVWNLALIIVAVYASFSIFQSNTAKGKLLSGVLASAVLAFLVYRAFGISPETSVAVAAPIFQQFNPFYVVALTPVSMAIFGALARKGKEPSAPRKIAYGMMVAACGFAIMAIGSRGLNTPNDQARAIAVEKAEVLAQDIYAAQGNEEAMKVAEKAKSDFEGKLTAETKEIFEQVFAAQSTILAAADVEVMTETPAEGEEVVVAETTENPAIAEAEATLAAIKAETKPSTRTSAYWLILTYLILTFAELLLSPMGISFVSKVAPPKLKGLMMGGWFVATAIGNMLVAVGGFLWAGLPLWSVWGVFIVLCLLSALFMFVMMKRLESVTK